MVVNLGPETQRLLEQRMKAGGYEDAEGAILAALLSWEQDDPLAAYSTEEINALIEEGRESLRKHGPLTLAQVEESVRRRLHARRQPQ